MTSGLGQTTTERKRRGGSEKEAARQASLREHNLSLVFREVVESAQPTTRAKIAATVGLTRATVSDLVDRLIRGRLVVETELESLTRAGRPGVQLRPASETLVGLGLQVQVDQISVFALDLAGRVVGSVLEQGDFRRSDPAATIAQLGRLAAPILEQAAVQGWTIVGACVSIPGVIRLGSEVVHLAPNLGWRNVNVAELLRQIPGFESIEIELGNDADLAARAETRARARAAGEGRRAQSFLYVAGQVGVGGAFVIDGTLASGQHGWSGEIGHLVVDPNGPACACGSTGCLEVYAGKDALLKRAGLSLTDPLDPLLVSDGGGATRIRQALDEAAQALGRAAAVALNLVDVDTVILGGIYALLYEQLRDGVQREVDRRVLAARWSPVRVERALTGVDAAPIGAALTVLDRVVAQPARWVPLD